MINLNELKVIIDDDDTIPQKQKDYILKLANDARTFNDSIKEKYNIGDEAAESLIEIRMSKLDFKKKLDTILESILEDFEDYSKKFLSMPDNMIADSKLKGVILMIYQKDSDLKTFDLGIDAITILLEWSVYGEFKKLADLEDSF